MRARAVWLALVTLAFVAIPGATQADRAGPAPGPTQLGLATVRDVAGLTAAPAPDAARQAWSALLPAAARAGAAVGLLRETKLALVSRVAQTGSSAQAAALARTLRRLPGARLSRLDSAAVGRGSLDPGRAHAVWSAGSWVGQVSVLGAGRQGAALARAVAASVRSRVAGALGETAWQKVLAQVRSDGSVGVDTALEAFSLAIAPIPGVKVPPGPAGTIPDGTLAINWVLSNYDKLTPAQRASVTKALSGLHGGTRHAIRRLAGVAACGNSQDWHPDATYQTIAAQEASAIGAKLHLPLTLTLCAGWSSLSKKNQIADTLILNDKGGWQTGPAATCWVTILSPGQKYTGTALRATLARHAFHCFQGQIAGIPDAYTMGAWVINGGAFWAACNLVNGADDGGRWQQYMDTPGTALFARSGDADGFFSLLSQHGIDLWSRWPAIIKHGVVGDQPAYQAAVGAQAETILWDWASSYNQYPQPSADWDIAGPCKPGVGTSAPEGLHIANGTTANVTANAWTIQLAAAFSTADVVSIAPHKGHVRLKSGNLLDERLNLQTYYYCTRAQGDCACPNSSQPTPTRILANGGSLIALTGGPTGAEATVNGMSLADYCKPKPIGNGGCFVSAATLQSILGLSDSVVIQTVHQNQVARSFTCVVGAWNGGEPGSIPEAIQAAQRGKAAAFGGTTWEPGASPQAWVSVGFDALVAGLKTHSTPIVPLLGPGGGPVVGQPFAPHQSFGFGVTAWLMPNVPRTGIVSADACWWNQRSYKVICLGLEEQAGKPIVQHLDQIAAAAVPAFLS